MKYTKKEVAICFVSNMGYLPHFYAAIGSFLKFNSGSHKFFLFNEDIPAEDFSVLQQWVAKRSPNSLVTDVKLDTSRLPEFTGYWEKLGKQVFHRLLIPDELPREFEFALYLDADIIFQSIFDIELILPNKHSIAAVRDTISEYLAPKRGLEKYFNAGIMLINIQQWKAKNALHLLLNHTPAKTLFAEQELLNEVFANDWYELPAQYNYAANHLRMNGMQYRMRNGQTPTIIHYLGGVKPWKYWVRGSTLYWRYIWQTPYKWQIFKAPVTVLNSILHLAKKPFK